MELPIRDSYMKQLTLLAFGNYHAFMFVKIIYMAWALPLKELLTTQNSIKREIKSLAFRLMVKMYLLLGKP